MSGLLRAALAPYSWVWEVKPDDAPNVGDIVYRFSLAATAYGLGIAGALLAA